MEREKKEIISPEEQGSVFASEKEKEESAQSLAEHGLLEMRKILGSSLMDEITLISSSAMFILGKIKRDKHEPDWESFHKAPGDLDGVVSSLQALERIKEKLARVENVTFGNAHFSSHEAKRGEFMSFQGQGTKTYVLTGSFPVEFPALVMGENKTLVAPYEFELFYNTPIVDKEDLKSRISYKGMFHLLNERALRRQYEKIKDLEERKQVATGEPGKNKIPKREMNIAQLTEAIERSIQDIHTGSTE